MILWELNFNHVLYISEEKTLFDAAIQSEEDLCHHQHKQFIIFKPDVTSWHFDEWGLLLLICFT